MLVCGWRAWGVDEGWLPLVPTRPQRYCDPVLLVCWPSLPGFSLRHVNQFSNCRLDLQPDEYEKEMWQMDEKEQEEAVPRLRQQGNAFVKEKKFQEASVKYGEALSILENCSLKEKVACDICSKK